MRSHEWLSAVFADQPEEARKSMWFSRLIVTFHAAVFAAAITSGKPIFILIVNFHCFFANWLSFAVFLHFFMTGYMFSNDSILRSGTDLQRRHTVVW